MSFKKAFIFIIVAEAMIGLLALNNYGFNLEGLQATTRFSGRFSLVIFSFIFLYLSFNHDNLNFFLHTKPFHVFAITHGIHLIELVSYVYASKADLIPIRLAGGFLAYVFIFVMPFIHTQFKNGKLAFKKYLLTENIYMYYVWFIFFMSYLPRVQGKLPHAGGSYPEFVVLLIWVCLLLVVKLLAQFNLVQKRSA